MWFGDPCHLIGGHVTRSRAPKLNYSTKCMQNKKKKDVVMLDKKSAN